MTDSKLPSPNGYEGSPEYQQHQSKVMSDYDHPTGLIEELVSQLADAFWWIKVYRRDKEQIVIAQMTTILTGTSVYVSRDEVRWLNTAEALSAMLAGQELGKDAADLIEDLMVQGQHNLMSLRSEAMSRVLSDIDTLDRLIDRQFKNIKLLMQAVESVRFAPELHKKLKLEVEQLEFQIQKAHEDQRLEVDRQ
ncbi:MAG: hypothetical protein ACPG6R_11200 [Aequoribacter sp.]|uniref:hypothetical protein n=1 Tax=Aequoribacter sp. TaxID=2847771 RepID=UPI003C57DC34